MTTRHPDRRTATVIGVVLLLAGIALALAAVLATPAGAQDDPGYGVTPCYSSGRGTGDLVYITDSGKALGYYVVIVGLDRDPTTYILVLPGETWQVTDGTSVVASDTVDISDCEGETTTTTTEPPTTTTVPPSSTTQPPDTTTTSFIDACDDHECPPNPSTTSRPPRPPRDTTTTTEGDAPVPSSSSPPPPGGDTDDTLPVTGPPEDLQGVAVLAGLLLLAGGGIIGAEWRSRKADR